MTEEHSGPVDWSHAQPDLSPEHRHIYTLLRQIDRLRGATWADLDSAILAVNKTSVMSVPGARSAGITLIDEEGQITTVGGTNGFAFTLDDIQRRTRQGPCLSAAWNQQSIVIDDVAAESRWPDYRDAALQETPVRSVLSLKLFSEGSSLSALNFYAESPGVFDDESVELAVVFAAHTTVAWNILRREDQFHSALASRDVIGQAKGILMERFDIDAYEAFELLRRLSQESNMRLVEIAQRLVISEHPPRARARRTDSSHRRVQLRP